MRLLFVCLGNICRSPTAEGVMRELIRRQALEQEIALDSAGTGGWHVGEQPDRRAAAAARARGITLDGCARQIHASDFDEFDLILAMDRANLRALQSLAPAAHACAKVRLLREFDPISVDAGELEVPDPYYDGSEGFERVLDLVQRACEGLLEQLRLGTPLGIAHDPAHRGA